MPVSQMERDNGEHGVPIEMSPGFCTWFIVDISATSIRRLRSNLSIAVCLGPPPTCAQLPPLTKIYDNISTVKPEVMFQRKSSVATVDYPAHDPLLHQHPRDARRHSAAPFSLATRPPAADSKYQTSDISRHSKTLSSRGNRFTVVEDTGNERALLSRMGRKLSTFLPIGPPAEAQGLPVLRINMKKEVHISMEESAKDVGSSGNDSPVCKPPYLWKRPGDEVNHRLPAHDSGISLTPATLPSSLGDRRSRRKPVPLSLADTSYLTTTQIEQSYPSFSEQPGFQTPPPARSYSVAPEGILCSKHSSRSQSDEDTSNKQSDAVFSARKASVSLPPPIPPRSPKRTQHMSHTQPKRPQTAISTVVVPIRPAEMQSLGTALKSLFCGRTGKGKLAYNKKAAVLIARKASLKRTKGMATLSPVKLSYQPHSARTASLAPGSTPKDYRSEFSAFSRLFRIASSQRLGRKRKSSLPSFLSMDSRT